MAYLPLWVLVLSLPLFLSLLFAIGDQIGLLGAGNQLVQPRHPNLRRGGGLHDGETVPAAQKGPPRSPCSRHDDERGCREGREVEEGGRGVEDAGGARVGWGGREGWG